MQGEFWLNRWAENQIGFHLKGVNPYLTRFWSSVSGAGTGRVLVPLCGKSEDLRWLAERGHDVVGVELSLLAAKAFATEQRIVFTESHEPPFTVFRGKGITYLVGDFFDFTPEIGGHFDLFYDRAALIALPPEMRPAYALHLASLVKKGGQGLLVDIEYDPSQMHGPPYTVSESEVRRIFSSFHCEKLLEADILEDEPRFKARGLTWLREGIYHLKTK
jgi:thiopurine S-methyltransferase